MYHPNLSKIFNHTIEASIPNSVTDLIFDKSFNQSINGFMTDLVINLTLGSMYEHDITNIIPSKTSIIRGIYS